MDVFLFFNILSLSLSLSIHLCLLSPSFSLFIYLSLYLTPSFSLSLFINLCICLPFSLSSPIYLYLCLPLSLSIHRSPSSLYLSFLFFCVVLSCLSCLVFSQHYLHTLFKRLHTSISLRHTHTRLRKALIVTPPKPPGGHPSHYTSYTHYSLKQSPISVT